MAINFRVFCKRFLFAISGSLLTVLIALRGNPNDIKISLVLSFIVLLTMSFGSKFIEKASLTKSKISIILRLLFSLMTAYSFSLLFYNSNSYIFKALVNFIKLPNFIKVNDAKLLTLILGVSSVYALYIYFGYFCNTIGTYLIKQLKNFSALDYIIIICIFITLFSITVYTYSKTNGFYEAYYNDKFVKYDILFTSDSNMHIKDNVFININAHENDLRQPLFAVFSIPFTIVPSFISSFIKLNNSLYPILIVGVQILLLLVTVFLISDMLKLKSIYKYLFILLVLAAYPSLIFSIIIEQYMFAVFYLILFIHCYLNKSDQSVLDLSYIAATGSLLTSGIVFFMLGSIKDFKNFVVNTLKCATKFFVITIITARTSIFINATKYINAYSEYTGKSVTFSDKINQYFVFIKSCLLKPFTTYDTTTYNHVSYQLEKLNSIEVVSIVLLILALIGFLVNYKNIVARISMFWVVFSFIVLFVLGWGTAENGLILYSLYFSWAFLVLWYLAIKKILSKHKLAFLSINLVAIFALVYLNTNGLFDLIKFSISFYPR